mmetsp:Transcript_12237/g.24806  ORF Transcript_12237/g.24806 Transcript_12237/m.24806 type:complete len:119 (+) Transcript_12237:640-996(+)
MTRRWSGFGEIRPWRGGGDQWDEGGVGVPGVFHWGNVNGYGVSWLEKAMKVVPAVNRRKSPICKLRIEKENDIDRMDCNLCWTKFICYCLLFLRVFFPASCVLFTKIETKKHSNMYNI